MKVAGNALNYTVGDRYLLTEQIGSGGAGSVYRAHDEVLGRDVAVKVFRAEASATADVLRQEQEVRILSTLQHPGLVAVHDAGRHWFGPDERRYVVMELVSEPSLFQRLETSPMPAHDVADLGAQIAEVLAYLDEQGIIHRDIKPANILVSELGSFGFRRTAKLTDFGIATYADQSRLTSDGTLMGTAGYLSPEQVAGEPVGGASDVYSLGLVLLEAITGVREFEGTVVESAIARLNRDPFIPEALAPEWHQLLTAMTRRDPARRPTAAQVAQLLGGRGSAGHGSLSPRRAAQIAAPAERHPGTRRTIATVAVLGGLALVGIGILIGALSF